MKLVFNIITKSDQLRAQVLKTKYKWNDVIPQDIVRSKSSRLWKGINLVRGEVRDSLVWMIGNGESIDFWREPWIGDIGTLEAQVTDQGRRATLPAIMVVEMVDENGDWKWTLINRLLPQHIILRLMATMNLKKVQELDKPVWKWNPTRMFTVRSTYDLRAGHNSKATEKLWKVIARFEGIQRVKIFLWLVACGKILTNSDRVHRHMDNDNKCGICRSSVETLERLFRECPAAMETWKSLVKPEKFNEFLEINIKD
ncbi:hypothetical protein F3Y22_tig00111358pilonHSYRG00126 [Hibiscus syriacus]|uniref:Reverse transcriptase zinc-binding domain-containing protein n=1 Tax=Hibiscus syriacus TaxID=106335 RepID=A0A6A2YNQ6_HIBSY|nr:hypothetical protein F3Y22_tig00111358pilonHSYRG00126 [Hibiscus syriacus]